LDLLGFVGCALGRDGELEHVLVGRTPGILEEAALVAHVEEVPVGGVGLLDRHRDRDALRLRVRDQVAPPAELPFAPGGDDAELGGEGRIRELEAHLVVALAGGAMGHGVGTFLARDLHLTPCDQRSGDRGPEEVLVLVDGSRAEHREDVVPGELLPQVLDDRLAGSRLAGTLGEPRQLRALPDVGAEGDDLGAVALDEPAEDDRGVEPARIREDNPPDGSFRGHSRSRSTAPPGNQLVDSLKNPVGSAETVKACNRRMPRRRTWSVRSGSPSRPRLPGSSSAGSPGSGSRSWAGSWPGTRSVWRAPRSCSSRSAGPPRVGCLRRSLGSRGFTSTMPTS